MLFLNMKCCFHTCVMTGPAVTYSPIKASGIRLHPMAPFSRFFRILSLPGFGSRRATDRQMGRIRTAMLSLLQVHGGHSVQRVAQRVRFAGDLEALWYLRQD